MPDMIDYGQQLEGNTTMYLNEAQVEQLLAPINGSRVRELRGMSYVAQHDIRAHMNRIFGFGRWSTRVISTDFIFEEPDGKRWKAAYRAVVEVTICAADGTVLASYQDAHVSGSAPQPARAEAHAMALTTAVSTAFKRACTNLGDQFGLSLYEKGQTSAIVRGTLVGSDTPQVPEVAVEADEESGSESEPTEEQVKVSADATEAADASHAEMLVVLRDLWTEKDDAKRILGVAAFKTEHSDRLDDLTEFGGKPMTFAKIADHIATTAMVKS